MIKGQQLLQWLYPNEKHQQNHYPQRETIKHEATGVEIKNK